MIVWTGWDLLVPICMFLGVATTGILSSLGVPPPFDMAAGWLAAAITMYFAAVMVEKYQVAVDEAIGSKKPRSNSFMFIPMRKWAEIVGAVLVLFVGILATGGVRRLLGFH